MHLLKRTPTLWKISDLCHPWIFCPWLYSNFALNNTKVVCERWLQSTFEHRSTPALSVHFRWMTASEKVATNWDTCTNFTKLGFLTSRGMPHEQYSKGQCNYEIWLLSSQAMKSPLLTMMKSKCYVSLQPWPKIV